MDYSRTYGKRITVADGIRLRLPRHFFYSTFAVLDRDIRTAQLRGYVCEDNPGTGFFIRNTDSQSYWKFIADCRKRMKKKARRCIFHTNRYFQKEENLVAKALAECQDEQKKQILGCYQNVVAMAKEEELLQRVVRAVKQRIQKKSKKPLVNVLMHYKSRIACLERDVALMQYDSAKGFTEAQMTAWNKVIEAFREVVNSRRIWSVYSDKDEQVYEQVFFDMGVFDYIKSKGDTPIMRDHRGIRYYLYPFGIVAASSTVDFDCYSWKDTEVCYNDVDISTLVVNPLFSGNTPKHKHHAKYSDALSTLYGTTHNQVVGSLSFSKLDALFFVNHTGPTSNLVKALNEFKQLLH